MLLAVTLLERFDTPAALWLALLPVPLWWMSRRSLAGLSAGRRRAALAARTVVILLMALALAGLQQIRKNRDLSVLLLLDQSRSIPPAQQDEARRLARAATREVPASDRVGAITFNGDAYIDQLPSKPGPDGGLFPDAQLVAPGTRADRTDIAGAIRMAMACFPEDTAKRIVLFSDGNQNVGDALTEAQAAAANKVAIDVVPIRYEYESEVMFERLQAPAYAHEQDTATLRLTLRSRRADSGVIRIEHDGRPVDLDPANPGGGQRVTLEPGLNSFTVRLPLNHSGAHKFEARFEPDDPAADGMAANNVATAFTTVEGPPNVLVLTARYDDDRPLIEALARENIRIDVQNAADADLSLIHLQQYAAVVLANVAADRFSEVQHRSLANYVRDLGGGLIMLGGDQGFGAGGWQASVVESVMPVRFDVDEIRQIPPGALALVMHACEMPQGNHWAIEMAIAAMKTLSRLDYFGVVAFAQMGTNWEVPMRLCDDKSAIAAQIRRMYHGDAPSFDDMMDLAYQGLVARRDAAQRHMIVISDGDPSPPSTGLINKLVANRITVSTVSVYPHGGREIATLQNIARQTGGNYYALAKPGDENRLPRIFIKEAKIVRRPLLREHEFAPRVKDRLSDLLAGVGEALPRLRGYVVTTPRSPAEIEMPLISDVGDPLLAHWQCGLGRAAAFTSGWWNYWGPDWIGWPSFSKLWAQTVRWCMAQGSAKDFEVASFVDGSRGRVVVEALNKDAEYLNFLQLQGLVVGPTGESRRLQLEQTGPGKYEGGFDMAETGTYLINLQAAGADQQPVLIRTGVSVAYSPEYRELSADESLLRRLVDLTGGRWLDVPAEQAALFLHNLPETLSRRPVWNLLLKGAILCFLLDVAVRRVAVDPRKIAVRVRGYIADLAGRFAPGRRAEAVLTDLKSVRDRVRAERTAAGDQADQPVRPVRPTRRFEAPTDAAAPAGDLTEALGGANEAAPPPKPGEKPAAPPAESTTARLLRSKKRRGGGDKPDTGP